MVFIIGLGSRGFGVFGSGVVFVVGDGEVFFWNSFWRFFRVGELEEIDEFFRFFFCFFSNLVDKVMYKMLEEVLETRWIFWLC